MNEAATCEQLSQQAAESFQQTYHRLPQWIAIAPGRVNIIGEHIDYNGGFVLPMAINRYVVAVAAENPELPRGTIRVSSGATESSFEFNLAELQPRPSGHWSDYVRGVFAGCLAQGMQLPEGLEIFIDSTVPLGGGLSSSAALEVSIATLLESVSNHPLDPMVKALLCQEAEHRYAGMPCGIMDQFSSALSQADCLTLLDCRSIDYRYIPFADPEVSILIVNSNVKHELTTGEYAIRSRQCQEIAQHFGIQQLRDLTPEMLQSRNSELSPVLQKRARHVVSEIARTQQAATAIQECNWHAAGQLMYQSHFSLKDDYEVSCGELDLLVEIAQSLGETEGIWGSRMTGGGFGGCTVSLVDTGAIDQIALKIEQRYSQATGLQPTIFHSRPENGAQQVSLDSIVAGMRETPR